MRTTAHVAANPGCSGSATTSSAGTQRTPIVSAVSAVSYSARSVRPITVVYAQPPWSSTCSPPTQ